MAMTAKTKAERTARLEARIEKINKSKADIAARLRSLDEDQKAAQRELEWIKGAPVSDAQPEKRQDEPVFTPLNEPTVAPAASPAEVAGVAEVATATQHL